MTSEPSPFVGFGCSLSGEHIWLQSRKLASLPRHSFSLLHTFSHVAMSCAVPPVPPLSSPPHAGISVSTRSDAQDQDTIRFIVTSSDLVERLTLHGECQSCRGSVSEANQVLAGSSALPFVP